MNRLLLHFILALSFVGIVHADDAARLAAVEAWQRHAETIAPELATTRSVYLSSAGDDAADGSTDARPVKTWARAVTLIAGDHVALLIHRGDTIAVDRQCEIKGTDVRIASFGDPAAAKPVLSLSVARSDLSIFNVFGSDIAISDLTFDSSVSTNTEKQNVANAVRVGGTRISVRGCTFLNVMCAVTGDSMPADSVTVDGCDAPLDTGVRAYFVFVSGTNWTVSNNRCANSTREHVLRGGVTGLVCTGNDFSNLDRSKVDPQDTSKSCINLQIGGGYLIDHNTFRGGPLSVGPLGGGDGLAYKANRVAGATITNNRLIGAQLQVQHGTSDVLIRNNLVTFDDGAAIYLYDFNAQYARGVANVTIDHNTVVNAATHGNFAHVGAGVVGTTLTNNVDVAPRLETGGWDAAALSVGELKSLVAVSGNRWGQPAKRGPATFGSDVIAGGAYVAMPKIFAADKTVAMTAATTSVDGAGVDVSKLPAVVIAPAAATQPAASAKTLYFDVVTGGTSVPAGYLPAIAEAGGRFRTGDGSEDSYYVGGYKGPNVDLDLAKVKTAGSQVPIDALYVIDNETPAWSTDVRHVTPAAAKVALDRYAAWCAAMRAGNPRVRLAIYDVLPRGEVYTPGYHAQAIAAVAKQAAGGTLSDHEVWLAAMGFRPTASGWDRDDTNPQQFASRDYYAWRAAGDADVAGGLRGGVDCVTPSVYLYGDIDHDTMLASVGEVIAEARRLSPGARVYPFVWPRYHQDETQQPPLDYWRQYVRLVLASADGCVLWGTRLPADQAYVDVVREEAVTR